MKQGKSKNYGFTLIELLVVIAIIAILAAILFPVFAKAREKARQAACLSNLKQLGTACMMYNDDNDGYYPPIWGHATGKLINGMAWPIWIDFCMTYIKNQQLMLCPSRISITAASSSDYQPTRADHGWVYSYGTNYDIINGYWYSSTSSAYGSPSSSETAINDVASIYLFSDSGDYAIMANAKSRPWKNLVLRPDGGNWEPGYIPGVGGVLGKTLVSFGSWNMSKHGAYLAQEEKDFATGRHSGGNNVAFADGHAKFQKAEVMVQQAQIADNNYNNTTNLKNAWQAGSGN